MAKVEMSPRESDLKLVQSAKAGNQTAFGTLVKKYQQKVFYLAFDLVHDYDDARDIAQEAFIKSFEKLQQFEERAQFSTWLYRIAVNLAMDQHRRRKRRPHESLEDNIREIERQKKVEQTEEGQRSEMELQTSAQRRQIDKALTALSKNQRAATVLKYFHQKSSKEIAEILGCSESTARIHLFRAMKNLRKQLKGVQEAL
ncbi:sigma-70 family RNA polymerase sigma factor [candidate division KSB1 bacterium]|nr:sigma-70 family RNA polymerase sigma factor [candidate division KSB1 bacterium]RQW04686.1 MAG: sigma-70 family RNA polymerase sigma factor [candidate division KSB1 bacterium]